MQKKGTIYEMTLQYKTTRIIKSTTSTTFFNNLRGNQLPAALKESHVSVNKYIKPLFYMSPTDCTDDFAPKIIEYYRIYRSSECEIRRLGKIF